MSGRRAGGRPPVGQSSLSFGWIFFLTFLWVGHTVKAGGKEVPALPAASVVPGTASDPADQIDAFDVAIGPSESLHIVWRQVIQRQGGRQPIYQTLYTRGKAGGASWSSPEELRSLRGAPPRIFQAHDGVHVLAGRELHHLFREESGAWQELGHVMPEDTRVVEGIIPGLAYFGVAVDAVQVGRELAVVYLAQRTGTAALSLDFVLWHPESTATIRRLAEFKHGNPQQAAPHLLAVDRQLHLLWAVGEQVRESVGRKSDVVEIYSSKARLFYMRSEDGGIHWGNPVEVTLKLPKPPQVIDDLEVLLTPEGLVALYSSRGLYLSRSVDGRSWSRPEQVAKYHERAGTTSTGAWSLTSAEGAIAWIDERFQPTRRRWWKPLGGWPWADSPEGVGNDVFFFSRSMFQRTLRGARVEPLRQTEEASFAFLVHLRASPEHLYVVWTGRRRTGAATGQHPVTPEIFYRILTQ